MHDLHSRFKLIYNIIQLVLAEFSVLLTPLSIPPTFPEMLPSPQCEYLFLKDCIDNVLCLIGWSS